MTYVHCAAVERREPSLVFCDDLRGGMGLGREAQFGGDVYIIMTHSRGEGNGNTLQYSCLENPMDGGGRLRRSAVRGVAKSWARLSNFTFTFHFHALEKEMATHSSIIAWRIPGTGETGGLPSMGSHRVGHD